MLLCRCGFASFVPGLSLSYLDRNVIVGDSLLGVASPETVGNQGTIWYDRLLEALGDAIAAVGQLADIDDRTPEEVEASKVADAEAWAATERARQLFDLWTAQGFGVDYEMYIETYGLDVISGRVDKQGGQLIGTAELLGRENRFLHWPLAFPRVFDPRRKRPGFDVVVGNPPWEEVTIEELSFYAMRKPGINSMPSDSRAKAINDLIRERPDLPNLLQQEQKRVASSEEGVGSRRVHINGRRPRPLQVFLSALPTVDTAGWFYRGGVTQEYLYQPGVPWIPGLVVW